MCSATWHGAKSCSKILLMGYQVNQIAVHTEFTFRASLLLHIINTPEMISNTKHNYTGLVLLVKITGLHTSSLVYTTVYSWFLAVSRVSFHSAVKRLTAKSHASRLDVLMIISLWNLTGISAALPGYLSIYRAIGKIWTHISRLGDHTTMPQDTLVWLTLKQLGQFWRRDACVII